MAFYVGVSAQTTHVVRAHEQKVYLHLLFTFLFRHSKTLCLKGEPIKFSVA